MKFFLGALISLILFSNSLWAQETDTLPADTTRMLQIETRDGNTFTGRLVTENVNQITLSTQSGGLVTIDKRQITKMKDLRTTTFKDGEYWEENPNATRHFFSPAGFGLRKGEGYYQNIWIIFNSVNYGITDNFSIGGGLEAFSTLAGRPAFFITPKFSIPVAENFHTGVGAIYFLIPWIDDDPLSLGILYGVGTFGSRDKNLTLGLGYGFANGEFAQYPTFNLSGMLRIGKNWSLVSENWFLSTEDQVVDILSIGARLIRRSFSMDFAIVTNSDIISESLILGLPLIGIVLPFGNPKTRKK